MKTRKVKIRIYRCPEYSLRCLSLALLSQVEDELFYSTSRITDKSLSDLLTQYEEFVLRCSAFEDDVFVYRILVRDSENRISLYFKA